MVLRILLIWLCLSVSAWGAEIVLDDTTTLRDATTKNDATGCDGNSCRWYNFGWHAGFVGHNLTTAQARQLIGFNISSLPADIDSFIYYFRVGPAAFPAIDESKPCSTGFYWVDESYGALTEGEGTPGVPGFYDVESPAFTWKFRNYDSPTGGGDADSTDWNTSGGIAGYYCGGADVDTTNGWSFLIIDTCGLYSVDLTTNVQAALDASDTDIWFLMIPYYLLNSISVHISRAGEFRKAFYSAEYAAAAAPWPDSAPYVRVVYPDQNNRRRKAILGSQ